MTCSNALYNTFWKIGRDCIKQFTILERKLCRCSQSRNFLETWPDHNTGSYVPYSWSAQIFLTSLTAIKETQQASVCRPNSKGLGCLTIRRCHGKGSVFSYIASDLFRANCSCYFFLTFFRNDGCFIGGLNRSFFQEHFSFGQAR